MIDLAGELELEGVLAPVRPTRKHEVPDEPVDEYINRRNDNGGLWDPWLRVHEDIGGKCLGIAETALTVNGKISEWETWCQMGFPQAGKYPIPGGLVPVVIDRGADSGTYVEPNVWYFHQSARR
jgi:hypothetical protein